MPAELRLLDTELTYLTSWMGTTGDKYYDAVFGYYDTGTVAGTEVAFFMGGSSIGW